MKLLVIPFLFCILNSFPSGSLLSTDLRHSASLSFDNGDTINSPQRNSRSPLKHIVQEIQDGVNGADMRMFSGYFAKQISISLGENENGYFSANQAMLVLQDYFSSKRNVKFFFSTANISEETPYATGGGTYFIRGTIRHFQIYVSFAMADDRWVITQFNVY